MVDDYFMLILILIILKKLQGLMALAKPFKLRII